MHKRFIIPLIAAMAIVSLAAAPATAARKKAPKVRPAVTTMSFSLSDKDLDPGEQTVGTATVRTRSGKSWVALAGATVSFAVDGVAVGTATTDASGVATFTHTESAIGSHTFKASYAGDATHKSAKRAQGFGVYGTWYADVDVDGYGDAAVPERALAQPEGSVEDDTDCDDADAAVNPGATEDPANGIDDNCDGQVDEVV